MLRPHLQRSRELTGVAEGQRLDEVRVQRATVRARHHVAVVAEEVQSLRWMQHRLVTGVTLKQRKHTVIDDDKS